MYVAEAGRPAKRGAATVDLGRLMIRHRPSVVRRPVTLTRAPHQQIGEQLGKGAFGVVYKALNMQTGETVAIKRICIDGIPQSEIPQLESELTLLNKLNHPNVVRVVGFSRNVRYLNIMLEYIENGSLLHVLKRFGHFPETLTAVYMCQVLEGLAYLHSKGVIHRDIKASNLLTTKGGRVKLADFGVATISAAAGTMAPASATFGSSSDPTPRDRNSPMGTPYWMAPEVIELAPDVTCSCDIWSLGCTIIELMTGDPPFFQMPPIAAMYHIVERRDSPPPFPEDISPALEDFLTKCFERDHHVRPLAKDLLKHRWIAESIARRRRNAVDKDTIAESIVRDVSEGNLFARLPSGKPLYVEDLAATTSAGPQGMTLSGRPSAPRTDGGATPPGHLRAAAREDAAASPGAEGGHPAPLDDPLQDVFDLEDTLEDVHQQVVVAFRNTQELQDEVKRLDKKIELLIRNRISVTDVVYATTAAGASGPSRSGSLDAAAAAAAAVATRHSTSVTFDSQDHALVEEYGRLFYLLQTTPRYLANLIFFAASPDNMSGSPNRHHQLVLALFGFAFSPREEYLLLRLFETAIEREIENLTSVTAFAVEAHVLIALIITYNHRVQERNFFRLMLGAQVAAVLDAPPDTSFEYQTAKVSQDLLNLREATTGQPLGHDAAGGADDDGHDSESHVQHVARTRLHHLLRTVDAFLSALFQAYASFPYGLRLILSKVANGLRRRFGAAARPEDVYAQLGYILTYRCINPIIVSPEDYELAAAVSLHQRRCLMMVSRVLSKIASNRQETPPGVLVDVAAAAAQSNTPEPSGNGEPRAAASRSAIAGAAPIIKSISGGHVSTVSVACGLKPLSATCSPAMSTCWNPPSPATFPHQIGPYALQPPPKPISLLMREGEGPVDILNAYVASRIVPFRRLLDALTADVPTPSDALNVSDKYLRYLETAEPTIYITPGEIFRTHRMIRAQIEQIAPDSADTLHVLIRSMRLPPKTPPPGVGDGRQIALVLRPSLAAAPDERLRKLYAATKKAVAKLIRDRGGGAIANVDLLGLLTCRETYAIQQLSHTAVTLLANLNDLEEAGWVARGDGYRRILDDIQRDMDCRAAIRSNLEKELAHLRTLLASLKDTAKYLHAQMAAYNTYIKACLEEAMRCRVSHRRRAKALAAESQAAPSGELRDKFHRVKYTCAALIKKGVISHLNMTPSQQACLTFEICETCVAGRFHVSVFAGSIKVQTAMLQLEDLLEMQDNQRPFIEFMDGRVKVRVNLLLYLLNKEVLRIGR